MDELYTTSRQNNLEGSRQVLESLNIYKEKTAQPGFSFFRKNTKREYDRTDLRRSERYTGEKKKYEDDDEDYQPSEPRMKKKRYSESSGSVMANHVPVEKNRPNFYGSVPNILVGHIFDSRMSACSAGVHRPTVAGIHGGPKGAYSLALSGGYEDDVDYGFCFTYTGEGGRDLKGTKNKPKNLRTAPQSKDQSLQRGNLALSASFETKKPVRVIRGYKLCSEFAPEMGYRYDGLYIVEKFWDCTGISGFKVFKFALSRLPGQPTPAWELPHKVSDSSDSEEVEMKTPGEKKEPEPSPPSPGDVKSSRASSGLSTVSVADSSEGPEFAGFERKSSLRRYSHLKKVAVEEF